MPYLDQVIHAAHVLVAYLAAIGWSALALALLCHLAKTAARTRSWRNILAEAYPDTPVRWRGVFGAYVAGVGVNALIPARGGDLLKLYLIKRRVPGSTYPTLTATLLVETVFDFTVALALLLWAVSLGVLPGLDVLPNLPSIDWSLLVRHPRASAVVGAAVVVALAALAVWASRRVAEFKHRFAAGFAILRRPRRYVRRVLLWQGLDWTLRLATIYWFLRAFHIGADLHNALLVQVAQSLSTILPLTPAGIGTEQALLVYVFAGKTSTGAIISFSVGMKIALIALNVALGFGAIALMLRTLRWRRMIERDRPDAKLGRSAY